MKFSAAVIVAQKYPLEIITLELPKLKSGQVLIRNIYTSICGTQLLEIEGYRGVDKYIPHCLGHESYSEVIEISHGVTKVSIGDKVVTSWIPSSGLEAGGVKYHSDHGLINGGPINTFSQYSIVSENRINRINYHLSDERYYALMGCAVATGFGCLHNTGQIKSTDKILIFGMGAIGLLASYYAKAVGCSTIVAVDKHQSRLSLAIKCGATRVITSDQFESESSQFNEYFDISLEASGVMKNISIALECIRQRSGKVIVVGNSKIGDQITINPTHFNLGKQIRGCWGGDTTIETDLRIFAELINSNKMPLELICNNNYALDDINTAIADMKSGTTIRPIIKFESR